VCTDFSDGGIAARLKRAAGVACVRRQVLAEVQREPRVVRRAGIVAVEFG
jgi:hypothetical protein